MKAGENKMKSHKPKYVEKDWGSEIWFANNESHDYCGKILEIQKDKHTSMHFHVSKHEIFYVLEGTLRVDWIDTETAKHNTAFVKQGDCMEMPQRVPHSLIASSDSVKLIEASTFHRDSDSHRIHR